jgi:hypothetical protein
MEGAEVIDEDAGLQETGLGLTGFLDDNEVSDGHDMPMVESRLSRASD